MTFAYCFLAVGPLLYCCARWNNDKAQLSALLDQFSDDSRANTRGYQYGIETSAGHMFVTNRPFLIDNVAHPESTDLRMHDLFVWPPGERVESKNEAMNAWWKYYRNHYSLTRLMPN